MTLASEQLKDPAGTGRILQKLARQRKQLAVYHTRPESAALMARLAIPEGLDWSDPKTVTKYRMADYSCGAGALLIAAYRRVRELHRQSGGSPREVHAAVLEDSITAVDVLPASVALAAAGLDALEPKPAQPGGATRALTLQYGPISCGTPSPEPEGWQERRAIGLGSLDLLDPAALRKQDLRAIGRGDAAGKQLKFPPASQDLVIMNPPFTKRPDPGTWTGTSQTRNSASNPPARRNWPGWKTGWKAFSSGSRRDGATASPSTSPTSPTGW